MFDVIVAVSDFLVVRFQLPAFAEKVVDVLRAAIELLQGGHVVGRRRQHG